MNIQIVNKSNNPLPQYETRYSAGMDVRAYIDDEYIRKLRSKCYKVGIEVFEVEDNYNNFITIRAGERVLIPTGLHIAIPEGYEIQVRPRSGLALKHSISIVNSPGTIDADYRGDIGVILINHSNEEFTVKSGDRICQIVLKEVWQIHWDEVKELEETERGDGGFGHTGSV